MKRRAVTFASAAFFVTSLALASDTWILDSRRSNVRVFRGSRTNPESVNTGVARVAGKVKLDTNDLDASVFNLSIFPADEDRRHGLSPEGTLPTAYVIGATDQTLLTFKSTRILSTGDGQLQVIGNLALNHVERSVIATKTEAYAGPADGVPFIHTETRKIMFLFPSVSTVHLSGPSTPAMLQKKGVLEIVGSARLDREEFPELLNAMEEPQSTPATGNQTTIVLDLKFLHTVPEPSAGMLSENGDTR